MDQISIRDYFEGKMLDHEKVHAAHDKAHDREHEQSQLAIDTAAVMAAQNKEDANEWREAMTDRESSFARVETLKSVDSRLGLLEDANLTRNVRDEERAKAQARTMAIFAIGATLASVAINLIIRLIP